MKRTFLLPVLFLCICLSVYPQIKVDKGIYMADFSNSLHQPKYVSYTLYKGGGDCDRDKFSFKNDDNRLQYATDDDYKGSNYDKGHLANAEDFKFD
jgi:endonuclease G, mitochondrial